MIEECGTETMSDLATGCRSKFSIEAVRLHTLCGLVRPKADIFSHSAAIDMSEGRWSLSLPNHKIEHQHMHLIV